jgi:HAD superfamily hydrolase (TIGR01509 family)
MIELVIFDCDGVLVDSEPLANQVLADHATRNGVPMTLAQSVEQFVGLSMASVLAKLSEMAPNPLPDDFLVQVQADTFARFRDHLKPIRGIHQAIAEISARGFNSCVASSGSYDKMALTLGLTGLDHIFAGRIFSAQDVARGKPEPDLFLHAAAKMGVLPAKTIVVEDSGPGIRAAIAAGMIALGYAPDATGPALQALGARVFSDMAQLPQLVQMIAEAASTAK